MVAPALLALGDRPGADAFEGGERTARCRRDPDVDHRPFGVLHERRPARAVGPREAAYLRRNRVVGEAEVVMDVPLHQRAAVVGHVLEGDRRSGSMNIADTSFLVPSGCGS